MTAAEAVEGDGDSLAGTRLEHGRTGSAELAPTGSRMGTRRRRQTGSGNRLIGSDGSARDTDVEDGLSVVERYGRVAATSFENCRNVCRNSSEFCCIKICFHGQHNTSNGIVTTYQI